MRMDFFEKVKKTAGSIAKVSSRESKKLYSIAKIKLEISEKKKKIKALYAEIGLEAYKAYREETNIARRIRGRLKKVEALEETIEELLETIDDLKNVEEVGVEDIPYDEEIEDAEIVEADEENDEDSDEAEFDGDPIEPIE